MTPTQPFSMPLTASSQAPCVPVKVRCTSYTWGSLWQQWQGQHGQQQQQHSAVSKE